MAKKKKAGLGDALAGVEFLEDLERKTNQEVEAMASLNILLVGKTGVGKSTLINGVFRENLAKTGIGAPVTDHLEKITKAGLPLVLYDTKGLELNLAYQKSVQDEIINLLNRTDGGPEEIHCIWYCINANSHRLEEIEKIWINGLSARCPLIVVLTQSFVPAFSQPLEAYIRTECPNIKDCIPVVAQPFELEGFTVPQKGLMELLQATQAVVPEEVQPAFINAQRLDIEGKARYARRWARAFIMETFAVGFIPIPFADAPIIAASQATMLAKITAIFGVNYDEARLASILAGVTGISGATLTGRTLSTNLLKLIPGAGHLVTGVISGTTAASVTKLLADAYINIMKQVAAKDYAGEEILPQQLKELAESELAKSLKGLKQK